MLPVSLECPHLIASLVFANVYLTMFNNMFSRLFIFCISNSFHSFQCKSIKLSHIEYMYLTSYFDGYHIRGRNCIPFTSTWVHPLFLVGPMLPLFFSFLCCVFVFCLSSSCVLCTQCCHCLWVVHEFARLAIRFSLTFIFIL